MMTHITTARPDVAPVWPAEVVDRDASAGPSWGLLLASSIASILFGVAVLAWPDASLRIFAVLVGCWLLASGIARIAGAFLPAWRTGSPVFSGIVGVLLVIAGVACLRDLAKGLALIAFFIALSWIFSGLASVVMSSYVRGSARVGLVLLGLVSMLIGVVFLVVPQLSLSVTVLLVGLGGLIVGAIELAVALKLRNDPGVVTKPGGSMQG